MDKLLTHHKVRIHVENDNLIMYGSATESAGCVLRGVMSLDLQETMKIKSISLELVGKMSVTWSDGVANSHERLFKEEKTIYSHVWTFLPKEQKLHVLKEGSYPYEFELALPGDLLESTNVSNLYTVQYQLKATIERSTFIPNISTRKTIYISRQFLPITQDFCEPFAIANQWANKLDYEISLPSKIFTHGDKIPVTIRITPLSNKLKVRHLSCALKEYMICRPTPQQRLFNTRPKAHGKVLFATQDDTFGRSNASHDANFIEWTKTQVIQLPNSYNELQCDIHNDTVRVRHKIKFILSLVNEDGHVSELRASLPITICAINNTGLPAYEETWHTLPYDPVTMLNLLYNNQQHGHLPSYNSLLEHNNTTTHNPPSYEQCIALSS